VETIYDLRVVNAKSVYDVLREMGIDNWSLVEEVPVADYQARDLAEAQRKELRFVPPMAAAIYQGPDGKPTTYFHISPGRAYSITFAVVPSPIGRLVPVTASYRPAVKRVILQLPSGGFKKGEDLAEGAAREFEEETRIALDRVEFLRRSAIPVHVGATGDLIFPCLGIPRNPVEKSSRNLDAGEFIGTVLFPVYEWLALLDGGDQEHIQIGDTQAAGPDMVTVGTTYLGLRQLRPPGVEDR